MPHRRWTCSSLSLMPGISRYSARIRSSTCSYGDMLMAGECPRPDPVEPGALRGPPLRVPLSSHIVRLFSKRCLGARRSCLTDGWSVVVHFPPNVRPELLEFVGHRIT